MIIEIDDTLTIEYIQEKFNDFFPFLKMEFYRHPHQWSEESQDTTVFPSNMRIGDIRKNHLHGEMKIYSWHKTGSVEQEFRKKYGLNVQVFRHHGNQWIETIGTDELTLEEQNEIGRKSSQDRLHGTDRKFENEKPL